MSFHHCTTPRALAAIPKYLVRWPAVLADIVFEVSLLPFWSPALECPVDMQVRLVSPLSLAVVPLPFRPLVVAFGTTGVYTGTVDQVSRLYNSFSFKFVDNFDMEFSQ